MSVELANALRPQYEVSADDKPWWLAAPELTRRIERQPEPSNSIYYQFGDAVLHVATDDTPLLETFEQLYGDCAVLAPVAPGKPRVRCMVRRQSGPPLLLLTFLAGAPRDPAAAFLPMRGTRVWDSPLAGWRLAGGRDPVLAARESHVLINAQWAWNEFPVEYLVNATLTAQPELVAIHAASLAMNNAGLVIAGPSHSGKSTTALNLAARGFTLLGDEVALIRTATSEIVPFRRTAKLRHGPRAPELSAAVGRLAGGSEPPVDEGLVRTLRIGELFPDSPARPARLRAAFFLTGFADHPSLAPCRPTLHDLEAFGIFASNEIATLWGLPPDRRALRLLTVKHLLDRLPCWLLKVGSPGATADLIQETMENLQC